MTKFHGVSRAMLMTGFLLTLAVTVSAPQARAMATGGDVSDLAWEQSGSHIAFKDAHGAVTDPLKYAKSQGWTACRLRLLVNPNGQGPLAQSLPYDLALAKRIKTAHMRLILDIMYSDGWADPGQQPTPAAWKNQTYPQLRATVTSYTKDVITRFKANGTLPDYVQIGNEISNGMLWPVGSLKNQSQFIGLIQAGIAGVRAVSTAPKIILHCNKAEDSTMVHWFFNTIASQCRYDVVGLSFYPDNGTNLTELARAMKTYDGQFGTRPIMLVEFGYKYGFGVTGGQGYPNTPKGQAQCVAAVVNIMKKHKQGAGVIYWGATFVTGNWGAESLFDYSTYRAEPAFSQLH